MGPMRTPMEREESFVLCETDDQSKFHAWNRALKAGALGQPRGLGWGGRLGGGFARGGTHVHPWLIHVKVWQKPPQYCKVISLQLKFFKKWEHTHTNTGRFVYTLFSSFCCCSPGPTRGVDFYSPLTAALEKVSAVACSSVGRRKWHGGAWWAAISGVPQSDTTEAT